MRRSIVLFAMLLGLLLAACAPAGAPAATPALTPTPLDNNPPAAATPQATEPAGEPSASAATPDMEKVLNPQPNDHKLGPDGAPVTIIEWGDFQ